MLLTLWRWFSRHAYIHVCNNTLCYATYFWSTVVIRFVIVRGTRFQQESDKFVLCCDLCAHVCNCNESPNICDKVFSAIPLDYVNGLIIQLEISAFIPGRIQTWNQVKRSNEQKGNVKTKPVSCETLAAEDPSAGGWAGYDIASARSCHVSPAPAGHGNNILLCQVTLYLLR
jgi:hypothetical protein